MQDRDIVAAILEGDSTGIAAAFGRYAQRLYAYCRSQLTEPADAADAVRDTFVIASAEISWLGQPDRLGAWLFALARNECQRRQRTAAPSSRLYEAAHAMDDTQTFAVGTQQAEFRAQVRAALAGLDPVDREISELNLRHGFYGADLADILGVPRGQAHTLAARARSRFEKSLGPLLLARSEREHCRELAAILDDQGGKPTRSLRRRVRRHFRRCEVCGVHKRSGLNPAVLLGLMPAVPLPDDLRRRTLGVDRGQDIDRGGLSRPRAGPRGAVRRRRLPGAGHDAVGAWPAGHRRGGGSRGGRGPGSAGRRHVLRRSGIRS